MHLSPNFFHYHLNIYNNRSMRSIGVVLVLVAVLTSATSLSCNLCLVASTLLGQSYRILPHSLSVSLLNAVCMKQYDSEKVCDTFSKELSPIIISSVFARMFNPNVLCGTLGMCPVRYQPINITEEIQRISNLPLHSSLIPSRPPTTDSYKIAHLSDIHLDVDYREGYSSVCKETVCCHQDNGISQNSTQNAGYYGNYRCDAPESLLDSAVRNIRLVEPDVKLVLLTGDLSAHNEWQKSQESNGRIANLVVSKFSEMNTTVLLAVGNNECYPDHQFNPNKEAAMKENIGNSISKYLTKEEEVTLKSKGFYSKYMQALGVRVIALNSLVCDDTNFYLIANVTDPSGQLEWLENQLVETQKQGVPVFIISHISPGITSCSYTWTIIYRALASRFKDIIRGHLYGHSHNDQFVILTDPLTSTPSSVILQAPSLTPVGSHEPSFRILEVSSSTHQILNYKQYSANLARANLNKEVDMKWVETYDFLSEYGLEDMSTPQVVELQRRLLTSPQTLAKYRSHTDGGHSTGSGTKNMYCDTLDDHLKQYECKGLQPIDDKQVYILELLQGQWLKRVDSKE